MKTKSPNGQKTFEETKRGGERKCHLNSVFFQKSAPGKTTHYEDDAAIL